MTDDERIPTPPPGYSNCQHSRPLPDTDGEGNGGYVNHLVAIVGRGTPGPTVCGLTRFDSQPGANDADLPGWSMGGGIAGPGIRQVKCEACWNAVLAEGAER